eukprot:gene14983-17718_t
MTTPSISIDKVWFITGASKGLGLATTKKMISLGYKVVSTSRSKEELNLAAGPDSDNFLALQMDLLSEASIYEAFQQTLVKFGRIDYLLNNAGYGMVGAVEEMTDADIKKNYDVNVFAIFTILRVVAPILRKQMSGHVINVSSIGGFFGFPGWATYCSTKFAVDGITESFGAEMAQFNIKVSSVNPGSFITSFFSDNLHEPKVSMPEYKSLTDVIDSIKEKRNNNIKVTGGDPDKFADVLVQLVNHAGQVPQHLYIGSDAIAMAKSQLAKRLADITEWEHICSKTDLPGSQDFLVDLFK